MKKSSPLTDETVIFTGTPKSLDVFALVEEYGGHAKSLPLIAVEEMIQETDQLRLEACAMYDWLIFTSQSAVRAFGDKLCRHDMTAEMFSANIAAVGTKTAEALERIGFTVKFIPTIFSADVFVKEFNPVENDTRRLLFLRGNMAGHMIREELPFKVDEWTVYKTSYLADNAIKIIDEIQHREHVSIIFASPSAVDVFSKEVVPQIGWEGYTICAIGHVTEKALKNVGATVDVRPNIYTLEAVVKKLATRKEGSF